jgi:hypothetical protein
LSYANANDANHHEKILPKLIGIKKIEMIEVPLVISKTKGTFFMLKFFSKNLKTKKS